MLRARSGAPGFRFARSALPPALNSTHILAGLQTYGLLIRPAKTSHTAGTLGAMLDGYNG
jgi:hypothetical protein